MSQERPITGHRKLKLMRLLASGDHTYKELAEMFDSAYDTIVQFKHRYKAEVEEIQKDLNNEFAGLWVAEKRNRIATYEAQLDRISESDDPKLLARAQTALRSIAEELGDLKTSVSVDPLTVNYKVEGVDPEAMK